MRSRTMRLIGYPIAAYLGALTAWGRVVELDSKGWSTPDAMFATSVLTIIVVALVVFVTEAFACNLGEEGPRV